MGLDYHLVEQGFIVFQGCLLGVFRCWVSPPLWRVLTHIPGIVAAGVVGVLSGWDWSMFHRWLHPLRGLKWVFGIFRAFTWSWLASHLGRALAFARLCRALRGIPHFHRTCQVNHTTHTDFHDSRTR